MVDLKAPVVNEGTITAGVATYPAGAEYGPRMLEDYELVWMIEGDAIYGRDDERWTAPAGSVVLCQPGARDYFHWDRNKKTRHAFTHFMLSVIPEHWPEPSNWPIVRQMPTDDVIRPMFRHLLTWLRYQPEEHVHLMLATILDVFISGNIAAGTIERDDLPDAVQMVTNFISRALDEEPSKAIALSDLAEMASMTPEHLCRIFKSSTGQTPMETVRIARLTYASSLLIRSNYTISEVSALCGFANPYHFSRLYKQHYGKSPKHTRLL